MIAAQAHQHRTLTLSEVAYLILGSGAPVGGEYARGQVEESVTISTGLPGNQMVDVHKLDEKDWLWV